ncbi:MAG: hypothetical protein D6706_05885 [Chloroflexi bacterium]|nr:MAG: hypothetical protein D6706_05885 [Chloroflexota bacterium]
MTGIAAPIIFAFLIATAYGATFHLLFGGPPRHLILYLLASWTGFALGHFLGTFLNITLLKLGVIHLFSASLGAWVALLISRWLIKNEPSRQ